MNGYIYILSICNYLFNFCPFSINQTTIRWNRNIVNANEINIYIFLVHIDRENIYRKPQILMHVWKHTTHTYDA